MDILENEFGVLFLTIWILWSFYFLFCLIRFFSKKNRESYFVKNRSPWLITSSAVGQYLMTTSLCWKLIVTPNKFPNFIDHWYLWVMVPIHFIPYPLRSFRLIILFQMGEDADKQSSKVLAYLNTHQRWVSDFYFFLYQLVIQVALIIVAGIRQKVVEDNHLGKFGYGTTNFSYIVMAIFTVVMMSLLWTCVYKLRKVPDDLKLQLEFKIIGGSWFFGIIGYIVFGMLGLPPSDAVDKTTPGILPRTISPIFGLLECMVSLLASFAMTIHLAEVKPPDIKIGVDVLDSMEALIQDKEASALFKKFLDSRLGTPPFLFVKEVEIFRNIHDEEQLKAKFLDIRNKYIKSSSANHINVQAQVIAEIEKIDVERDHIDDSVFDKARTKCMFLLETNFLGEFKATKEAIAFAKEKQKGQFIVGADDSTLGTGN